MRLKLSTSEAIDLGAALALQFKQSGLTQSELEALTKVDQTQISRILSGDFVFVSPNVEAICKLLGVSYARFSRIRVALGDPSPSKLSERPAPADPIAPEALVLQAFESVWDGSPRHALAIGDLIRVAGPLVYGRQR